MKLLAIDSSILTKASVSRKLTNNFVNQWQQVYPETEVIYRDLHAQPINHLSQKFWLPVRLILPTFQQK